MSRKQWVKYWIGIFSIQVFIQIFHLYNYFTQPSLGEFYTGKTVVYSTFVFGLSGLIFVGTNIYSFIVCSKNKRGFLWIVVFISGILFLVLSELFFSKIAEEFFPLNVWEQSTLKKLQPAR